MIALIESICFAFLLGEDQFYKKKLKHAGKFDKFTDNLYKFLYINVDICNEISKISGDASKNQAIAG